MHYRFLALPAAEQIPTATITFVALLLLLQLNMSAPLATLCAALLFVPWAVGAWWKRDWTSASGLHRKIRLVQLLQLLALLILAWSVQHGEWASWAALFANSTIAALHHALSKAYFHQCVHPRLRPLYRVPRNTLSHAMVVLTYGILIIAVGVLEVFYRQIPIAWATGIYLMSVAYLLVILLGHPVLSRPKSSTITQHPLPISQQPTGWLWMGLLLLPQALMFYARVLFLFDEPERGGLGCTIQEIGFAQGTVGVIAFAFGLGIGHWLLQWIPRRRLFWPFAILLGLSPLLYLLMSYEPPQSLPVLCIATFQAQLCFGLGLRLLTSSRQLTLMLPAMAASGLLVEWLGYRDFFLLDVLTVPVAWTICAIARFRGNCLIK